MPTPRAEAPRPSKQALATVASLALILLVAWLTLFHKLGASSIDTALVDEAMHTGATLELARSGGFHPTYHGQPYYGKPPLKMWVTARLVNLFGPSETVLRAPDAVAALLTGLAIWLYGRASYGALAGLLAPIVLFTSQAYVFLHGAREGVQDSTLTLLVTLAVLCWSRAVDRGDGFLLAGLFMGMGILVKSLPAYLPVGIGIAFILLTRRFSLFRRPGFWFALVLPWIVFFAYHRHLYDRGGEISHNIVDRAFSWPYHREPWWRYGSWMAEGIEEWWWVFAIGALVAAVNLVRGRDHPDARILLWILGVLVPFSVSVSKLPWYAYPAYPAVALLVARTLLPPELWGGPARNNLKAISLFVTLVLAVARVRDTYLRTNAVQVSLAKRAIEASRQPSQPIVYVYGMPLSWLCPDEELYVLQQGARTVPVTDAALLARVVSAERGVRILMPEQSLPDLASEAGAEVMKRARIARFAGACEVASERKQEAPPRAFVVFDRDDLPAEMQPYTPIFMVRGFFPPEPCSGIGPMRWMGARGTLVVRGAGRIRLAFKAESLAKARTIVVVARGQTILDQQVVVWKDLVTEPFDADPEGTTLDLSVREGCDVVKDVLPGTEDGRCVSVAIAQVETRQLILP